MSNEKPNTDYYYIRSDDFAVIPVGMFSETLEGAQAAWDASDADAKLTAHKALIYLDVEDLLTLMDDLERAFNKTHPQ